MANRSGPWLVAGMGLPGSGKSSVFRTLGDLAGVRVFLEPEESAWSSVVPKRGTVGSFTTLSWFRAERVLRLFQADEIRKSGESVLVDAYNDKLFKRFLGEPGMEWVISSDDPYYGLAHSLAELDWHHLPEADAVVFFELDAETWTAMLEQRDRQQDRDRGLRGSFEAQGYMKEAARAYCSERNRELIIFRQLYSSPERAAEALRQELGERGVLL